ncbi:MAG: alanine--glyoxylate aminotransferase family protein [Anaerolineales bacterium]|nr:alanine--glyoxylate aminotransferase family protein [Anaerolineales bacterium]
MKDRTLLMIPGPIEFEPAVLSALGAPTTSHLAPNFIEAFGQALERMRQVFLSQDGQPFVLAGSGTLAMDLAGANLVEPGDRALVVHTGYFSDRFAALLERYGAQVTQVKAPVGGCPNLDEVEAALKTADYKLVTITHVDTSTAVIADVKGIAALARQYGALVIVDGVCSVAGEELRMSEWGIDVALTASQKAIGVPPGLALLVASQRAMAAFHKRKTPVSNYYADWSNWLSIMQAYEARKPAYFGTPPVNLIFALNVSLGQILAEGIEARFARHLVLGRACQAGIAALGLGQVPLRAEFAAHTLTAPRYPPGVNPAEFLPRVAQAGAVLAGGLHPQIKNEYFRIGHMGATHIGDVIATMAAIETALKQCGYAFSPGAGVSAAQVAG